MSLARVFQSVNRFNDKLPFVALVIGLSFSLLLQGCGSDDSKDAEKPNKEARSGNDSKKTIEESSNLASSNLNSSSNHVPEFLPLSSKNPSTLPAENTQSNHEQTPSTRSNPFRQNGEHLPPLQGGTALGSVALGTAPKPSSLANADFAQVSFEEEEKSERMVPSIDTSQLSDPELLKHDPALWLQRKSNLAAEYSKEINVQAELQVWSEIDQAIKDKKIVLPWLETSVVLNKKNAQIKQTWNQKQRDAWKDFVGLENELMTLRSEANTMKRQKQSASTEYQKRLQVIQQKLQYQLVLLQIAAFDETHLAANIFEQAARSSYAQKKYSNALGLANKSFVIRQQILGYHPDTIEALRLCGKICEDSGKGKEATDYYFNAVNLARKVWGADHLKTAEVADQFGLFILNHFSRNSNPTADDFKFAKVWLEEAVRIRSKLLKKDNILYAISQRNLGRLQSVLANLKRSNPGLHRQAADLCYKAAYQALEKNNVSKVDWNNFLLEYSAVKASLGQNSAAEEMLGKVTASLQSVGGQEKLTASSAEIFYRWALTCLRQKQTERLSVGKQRLTVAKQLSPKDPRSNTDSFRRKVDGALARVAQIESEAR